MTEEFDRDFWQTHWREDRAEGSGSMSGNPPNPYLMREITGLRPGTALDAGCGGGAEAIWLAARGWRVTAVDISSEALARAAGRAARDAIPTGRLEWIEADLTAWAPASRFDLVTTHYAHSTMPQSEFYDRLGGWVAPGGTLLIVGHRHAAHPPAHGGHQHPAEMPATRSATRPAAASASTATPATSAAVAAGLDGAQWDVVTAEEHARTLTGHGGRQVVLEDVVVRATRRR